MSPVLGARDTVIKSHRKLLVACELGQTNSLIRKGRLSPPASCIIELRACLCLAFICLFFLCYILKEIVEVWELPVSLPIDSRHL